MGRKHRSSHVRPVEDFSSQKTQQIRCLPNFFRYDAVAMIVSRPKLSWAERMYLPGVIVGLKITAGHFLRFVFGKGKVTMQYPEEKWTLPAGYRGAPTLVRDEEGREKCVSCQLCEFVCPPRAIRIKPGEIPLDSPHAKVEKAPKAFDIDMIRCIYCGLCEEVCPEEAIFLLKDYAITGLSRAEMVHDKAKLYELGGTLPKPIHKWDANK
jgi:NADH-quinone oxidoreductase subunit I